MGGRAPYSGAGRAPSPARAPAAAAAAAAANHHEQKKGKKGGDDYGDFADNDFVDPIAVAQAAVAAGNADAGGDAEPSSKKDKKKKKKKKGGGGGGFGDLPDEGDEGVEGGGGAGNGAAAAPASISEEIVIAEVSSVEPHPKTDTLVLLELESGAEGGIAEECACNSSTIAVGMKVVFARVGATLPGAPHVQIKRVKLKGKDSFGMVCDPKSLGLGAAEGTELVLGAAGIPDFPVGTLFRDAFEQIKAAYSDADGGGGGAADAAAEAPADDDFSGGFGSKKSKKKKKKKKKGDDDFDDASDEPAAAAAAAAEDAAPADVGGGGGGGFGKKKKKKKSKKLDLSKMSLEDAELMELSGQITAEELEAKRIEVEGADSDSDDGGDDADDDSGMTKEERKALRKKQKAAKKMLEEMQAADDAAKEKEEESLEVEFDIQDDFVVSTMVDDEYLTDEQRAAKAANAAASKAEEDADAAFKELEQEVKAEPKPGEPGGRMLTKAEKARAKKEAKKKGKKGAKAAAAPEEDEDAMLDRLAAEAARKAEKDAAQENVDDLLGEPNAANVAQTDEEKLAALNAKDVSKMSASQKKKHKDALKKLQKKLGVAPEGGAAAAQKTPEEELAEHEAKDTSSMSAAQKKKHKQKLKALTAKVGGGGGAPKPEAKTEVVEEEVVGEMPDGSLSFAQIKAQIAKKPKKLQAMLMQKAKRDEEERLAEIEEERLQAEEDAKILNEEERERIILERKIRQKAKAKEKKEQMRKEGRLLTKKQKEDQKKAEAFKAQMGLSGAGNPSVEGEGGGEDAAPAKRAVYGKKKKKRPVKKVEEKEEEPSKPEPAAEAADVAVPEAAAAAKKVGASYADGGGESESDEESMGVVHADAKVDNWEEASDEEEDVADDAGDDGEEDEDDSDSGSDSDSDDGMTAEERAMEARIDASRERREKRLEEARASRSEKNLRSPIVCVLGHVDTGKTKLLDKIRCTNVQDNEAGGITQQIGASFFPMETIKKQTDKVMGGKHGVPHNQPGLLIIDTPGHESFANLRSRGSNLCDIAILVIDIMHGLEPQTLESIKLLKKRRTPFVVALNKIDRCYDWKELSDMPTRDSLEQQPEHTRQEFEDRWIKVKVLLAEQGLNSELYWRNTDLKRVVSVVPTSAHTGEGIPDILLQLVNLTWAMMRERIMWHPEPQGTVIEVKVIEGHGTTIDIVLINGTIKETDTIVCCGVNGPIVQPIRALLTPHPLKEIRVKGEYLHWKEIRGAQGIKISAKGLEHAIAGSPIMVVQPGDDIEDLKEEVTGEIESIMDGFDKQAFGCYVMASTLGSLEALLSFLEDSSIPVSGISIGPVHRKDVTKASLMLEGDHKQFATVMAFDVPVDRDAQDAANACGVRIFTAEIVYHLFDQYTAYLAEIHAEKKREAADKVVFPCVLRIDPDAVFNKKSPIIFGVDVIEGVLKVGCPICIPSQEFLEIGRIGSIEMEQGKELRELKKGQKAAIRITPNSYSQSNYAYGRQFDYKDDLISKVTRTSIDLLKEFHADDMTREHWKLVISLKKLFGIF